MKTKILVIDKKTKTSYLTETDAIIPRYKLGDKIGVLSDPREPLKGYIEFEIIGVYTEQVLSKKDKSVISIVNYEVNTGETILEEEVEYKC